MIKVYPNKSLTLASNDDFLRVYYYTHKLRLRARVFVSIVNIDTHATLSFYPIDLQILDFNKTVRRLEGYRPMSTYRSTFVMNNLDDDQKQALDDNYPTLDQIDDMFTSAVYEHGCTITARLDKSGAIVVFLNQNEYAVSGYSPTLMDALVIALYKLQLANFDLASMAKPAKPVIRRG